MATSKSRASRASRGRSALLAAACLALGGAARVDPASAEDRTLIVARDMDLNSLDPARAFCDTCQIYLSSVYARLVDIGSDNTTIVPMLAASWEIGADQTTYTFRLNPDAKFSDGSAVEAKDVKWSLERLKNAQGGAAYLLESVKSIETPEAGTVVLSLASPNSELLGILTAPYAGILNSDVVIANGGDAGPEAATKDTAEQWLLANSAGAGPFVLASYSPNNELRLRRNDSYWGAKPAAAAVTLTQVKDAVSQLQMVESGNADVSTQVDPTTAKNADETRVTVASGPSLNMVYVALSPGAKSLPRPLDGKIRDAIAHAIDYDALIDLTVDGEGRRLASVLPEGFPGAGGVEPVAFDLERAKALMTEAGAADGFALDAVYPNVNQYGVEYTLMMQKIQQDLGEIKISLNLEPVEFSVWRSRVNSDGIPLTAVFFAPDYFGSSQYIQYFGMIDGSVWYKRSGAAADPALARPDAPALLQQALSAEGATRDETFRKLAEMIAGDRIILPILSPDNVFVSRKGLGGLRTSSCCNLVLSAVTWEE